MRERGNEKWGDQKILHKFSREWEGERKATGSIHPSIHADLKAEVL